MSTADQKRRALAWAGEFIDCIRQPRLTPDIPQGMRDEARRVLKHYPYKSEIGRLVFEEEIDDALIQHWTAMLEGSSDK